MARKKEAHHGGAWKVAYADFVTAMMALFMVLWISAQDEAILIATSKYFQSPFNSPLDATSGVLPYDSHASPNMGGDGSAESKNTLQTVDLDFMNTLAEEFYRLLNIQKTDDEAPIAVEVTSDGMRITLFDRPKRPLFEPDSTEFTPWGRMAMQNLAWLVDRHDFRAVVEGHTRAGIVFPDPAYTEWDLSTDQAHAVRRALTYYAVDPTRYQRVSGYGARSPLPMTNPTDPSNQRIVISLSVHAKPGQSRPSLAL